MPALTDAAEDRGFLRIILIVAATASFLAPFSGSAISVALPRIGSEFGAHTLELNWISSSYLLAAAACLVPFGKLADIHGRRRVFVTGLYAFSLTSILTLLARSTATLIALRVLQGISSAMIFATGVAIITSAFPARERGRALGLTVSAVYFGLSIGPFAGGLLTGHLGWRSLFVLVATLGLLAALLASWKLRGEWAEARGERLDLAGCALYAIALLALMVGFSRLPAAAGLRLVAGGIAGLAAFVAWELRSRAPLLNLRLFSGNPAFTFSNLSALINYSATFAVGFLLSLYLQYAKGLSPQQAGALLAVQPVVMALISPAAGRLSDRVASRLIASLGMAVSVAGLLLLARLRADTPLWAVAAGQAVLGAGFALFSSPNTNAVMGAVERRHYGVASSILGTMRLVGQMLSMGLAMVVFALHLGRAPVSAANVPDFVAAVRNAFAIFAALCFAGVFASLARGRPRAAAPAG